MADNVSPEYWACEDDPETLAETLSEKTRNFYKWFEGSPKFTRIIRSWAFYHGFYFEDGDYTWSAVKELSSAEIAVGVNHYRNLIQHILALTTQTRPAIKTKAKNTDHASLEQAKIGDQLGNHYMREREMEDFYYRAAEHALVMMEGYVFTPWNYDEGRVIIEQEAEEVLDEETGEVDIEITVEGVREGEIDPSNPTVFDVIYDVGMKDWGRRRWVNVRTWENKYDLIARESDPEIRERLEGAQYRTSDADYSYRFGNLSVMSDHDSDLIPVWNFYHVDSDACPGGVQFRYAADGIPISKPERNQYQNGAAMPLDRMVPGEILTSVDGYSMCVDLQPVQEMINSTFSTIATNLKATGFAGIAVPIGWDLEEEYFDNGVFLVRQEQQSQSKPEALNLTPSQQHHLKFYETCIQSLEYLSGVNSVARGQPEASLKSGEALKVMDSKAVQFSHSFMKSYYKMIERNMTFIIRTVRDEMQEDEPRLISISGEDTRTKLSAIFKEDIDRVDRIEVEIGNPLSKTVSGRMAIAKDLMDIGYLRTGEEYLTVLTTGQIKKFLEADDAELSLIHDENNYLRRGEEIEVDRLQDYHQLHIREHKALLNSVDAKRDPLLMRAVQSHVMGHLQAIVSPDVQIAQQALGYQIPVPALPAPAPDPTGMNPAAKQRQEPGEPSPPNVETNMQKQIPAAGVEA